MRSEGGKGNFTHFPIVIAAAFVAWLFVHVSFPTPDVTLSMLSEGYEGKWKTPLPVPFASGA